jgi:hypothetical protein
MKNLSNEQHISRNKPATAAIRGINIPISSPKVFESRKSEGLGGAIDGAGCAFEFEEIACWCLVEGQVQTRKTKFRAVLLVAECGPKAEGTKNRGPAVRTPDGDLVFEPLFEARPVLVTAAAVRNRSGRLRREHCVYRVRPGRRSLDAEAQKPSTRAKIGIRCVIKGVLLKNAAVGRGPEAIDALQQCRNISDSQLDLHLAVGDPPDVLASAFSSPRAHAISISRGSACPRAEEGCQIRARASIIASLPLPNARK